MASEVRVFQVSTPVGTAKTAPLITAMSMPSRVVRKVTVRVPPGPNGQLGFQIGMVGQQVIPVNAGEWVVTSDELMYWDVDGYPDSGAWQLISYNTGQYPHTIEIRFDVDLPPQLAAAGQGSVSSVQTIAPVSTVAIASQAGLDAGASAAQLAADQAALDAQLGQVTP